MLPIQRRPSCSPTPSTTPNFRAVAPLPEPGRGRWGGGPCNVSSVTIVYFPPTGNARQASAAMIGDRIYQTKPISHQPLIINCQPQNGDCYQFPSLELDSWPRFAPAD